MKRWPAISKVTIIGGGASLAIACGVRTGSITRASSKTDA
jgi:hypothetical protein